MTSKTRLVYLLITTFCLAGCGYKSRNPVSENGLPSADTIQTALAPRYAKGFKITVRPDGVKLLYISEPNNNHAIPELFALVPKGTKSRDTRWLYRYSDSDRQSDLHDHAATGRFYRSERL